MKRSAKTDLRRGALVGPLLFLLASPGPVFAQGEGGANVNIIVREVRVAPARAYVGDVVTIEMVWEYWGDMISNYYDTTFAEVSANGRVVARKPFVYNFGARLGDVYRETLRWDTRGMAPGTYRIRGEVPLRLDATPFDNFLVVKEPVLLVPEGASFPAGQEKGGAAVAKNPYWVERKGTE